MIVNLLFALIVIVGVPILVSNFEISDLWKKKRQ